jgi:hypothetical protein
MMSFVSYLLNKCRTNSAVVDLINQMKSTRQNVSILGQTVSTLEQRLEIFPNSVMPEIREISDSETIADLFSTLNTPDKMNTYTYYGSTLGRMRPSNDESTPKIRYVDLCRSIRPLSYSNNQYLLLNRRVSHGSLTGDIAKPSLTGADLIATVHQEDANSRSSSCLSDEHSSSTENSEEGGIDDLAYPTLNRETKKLIKRLLRRVEWTLFRSGFVQCAKRGQNTSKEEGNINLHSNTGSPSNFSNNKKRSRDSRDRASDDEQDDQRNKRNKSKSTVELSSLAGPRFACPFFKHDPQRYISCRTCAGPGWPTIHRLKYAKFFRKYFFTN